MKLASRAGLDILISRLPVTEQSEHRQVDVILPEGIDEPLKAILHQGARPWSSIRGSEDQDSTMIIYRDVNSLAQLHCSIQRRSITQGHLNEASSSGAYDGGSDTFVK